MSWKASITNITVISTTVIIILQMKAFNQVCEVPTPLLLHSGMLKCLLLCLAFTLQQQKKKGKGWVTEVWLPPLAAPLAAAGALALGYWGMPQGFLHWSQGCWKRPRGWLQMLQFLSDYLHLKAQDISNQKIGFVCWHVLISDCDSTKDPHAAALLCWYTPNATRSCSPQESIDLIAHALICFASPGL